MVNQETIKEARSALRKLQNSVTKRNPHYHMENTDENTHRLRALEGLCGCCDNLSVSYSNDRRGRRLVALRCDAGLHPFQLYMRTPLGKEPDCPRFINQDIKAQRLVENFPRLAGWIPEHKSAQLHKGKRVPGALERLKDLGGKSAILERTEDDPKVALLLFCDKNPLVLPELVTFFEALGAPMTDRDIRIQLGELLQNALYRPNLGFLRMIKGVQHVSYHTKRGWGIRYLNAY